MEGFLLVFETVTSLSQEVRRPFRFPFILPAAEAFAWSTSSSDEARASESGVDLRRPGFDFSRRIDADA